MVKKSQKNHKNGRKMAENHEEGPSKGREENENDYGNS